MDGSQVGVLEERDEVGLGSLLKSSDGGGLEPEIGLEVPVERNERRGKARGQFERARKDEERRKGGGRGRRGEGDARRRKDELGDLSNEPLEGELSDEELSRLEKAEKKKERLADVRLEKKRLEKRAKGKVATTTYLLVSPDLSKSDSSGSVSVRLQEGKTEKEGKSDTLSNVEKQT